MNMDPNVRNIGVNEDIAKNFIYYQDSSLSSYTVQIKYTLKINAFQEENALVTPPWKYFVVNSTY